MTDLTPEWRVTSTRDRRRVGARMSRLRKRLEREYGTPDLGNLPDPLEEAVFILLTYQTDIPRARAVWTALRSRFGTWEELASAPTKAVEAVLRPSGFQGWRATLIRRLLGAVFDRFGDYSLDSLRAMPREQAEKELRILPGMDTKSARCVLLYSLGHAAFPLDSNSFRFFDRYGVVAPGVRYRRRSLHNALEIIVPPGDRHALHVNLVVHGQATCLPQRPICSACVVKRRCKQAGLLN